jgi:hypothetical protein
MTWVTQPAGVRFFAAVFRQGAGIAQSVYQLATDWTVRGSNSGGGEIFRTHPASYTMGTGSFPAVKRPGRDVYHPPPSSAEVKKRVQLNHHSPSGPSWPVLRSAFTFAVSRLTLVLQTSDAVSTRLSFLASIIAERETVYSSPSLMMLTHCGRVTQICVCTLQRCKKGDANLRF